MKTKRTKDRKSGSATLVVRPTKREQLVYSQAEWLVSRPHPNLAEFRYTLDGDEPTLYYDVTDLTDLKSYAKAPFGLAQYQALLVALGEVIDLCTRRDLPTSALQLDVDQVFMNADGAVRFVFVPLSGVPASKTGTAGALLQWLAQTGSHGNVRFVVPDDARHAEALFDYAKRNPVFSLADYKAFLASEFGVTTKAAPPAPKDPAAGGRGASGGLADRRAHAGAAAPAPAAFDPVALLYRAPSASEVVAGQGIADRVRGAVADVSPTAAPQPLAAPVVPVPPMPVTQPAAPAPEPAPPAPAPQPASAFPAPAPAPEPAPPAPAPQTAVTVAPQTASASSAPEPAPPQAADQVEAPAPPQAADQVEAPAPPQAAERVEAPAAPAPAAPPAPAVPAPAPGISVAPAPAPQPAPPAPRPAAPAPSGGTSLLGAGVVSRAGSSLASGFAPADCYLERMRDGARYRISGAATSVLGRSSSCDVKIDGNSNASRAHAQVRRVGASFEVVDLGSSNGTFVQGRRLSKGQAATVALGEEFELADETLRFVDR